MTTSEDPVVIGRFRDRTTDFTVSAPFSRFYAEAQKALAVDKLFFVLPGPGGYVLKEAGQLVVSFQPFDESSPLQLPPRPPTFEPYPAPVVNDDNQPAPQLPTAPPRADLPPVRRRGKGRPKKQAPGANAAPVPEQIALGLPSKPAAVGSVSIDGFKPASQAEDDAASMFGKIKP